MTEIKKAYPPNIYEIALVFPAARTNPDVVFAWGNEILVPSGKPLSPEVLAHEMVHCERQLAHEGGVIGWWDEYLSNPQFCLEEEILAHRAEYQNIVSRYRDRKTRRWGLTHVAKKLSSALYGRMISLEKAKEVIKNG